MHCVKCKKLTRTGNIYLCGQNHCYCESCHEKVTFNGKDNDKKCSVPGCKKYIYRSVIAEFLALQAGDIPCANNDLGCDYKDSLKGLELHLENHCKCQPIPCLNDKCRVSRKTLIQHITSEHKACHWIKKGNSFKLEYGVQDHLEKKPEEVWIPAVFQYQEVNYIFKNYKVKLITGIA